MVRPSLPLGYRVTSGWKSPDAYAAESLGRSLASRGKVHSSRLIERSSAITVAPEQQAQHATHEDVHTITDEAIARPRLPGILLGIGLGGFVDGIVLHQILQWHHMLTSEGSYPSTTVAGLETNTLWDGIFHAATWVAVAAGLLVLWRRTEDWRWAISGRAFLGWMLVGWGLFNVVEGVVDHHILTIHHVREGVANEWLYDIGFLAFGAALILGGWMLARSDEREIAASSTT